MLQLGAKVGYLRQSCCQVGILLAGCWVKDGEDERNKLARMYNGVKMGPDGGLQCRTAFDIRTNRKTMHDRACGKHAELVITLGKTRVMTTMDMAKAMKSGSNVHARSDAKTNT